jgi:hypothetical protein
VYLNATPIYGPIPYTYFTDYLPSLRIGIGFDEHLKKECPKSLIQELQDYRVKVSEDKKSLLSLDRHVEVTSEQKYDLLRFFGYDESDHLFYPRRSSILFDINRFIPGIEYKLIDMLLGCYKNYEASDIVTTAHRLSLVCKAWHLYIHEHPIIQGNIKASFNDTGTLAAKLRHNIYNNLMNKSYHSLLELIRKIVR